MNALFEFNSKLYTKKDLMLVLSDLGIKSDDTICVHSELFNLGKLRTSKNDFLSSIIKCLQECISESGTLIMPTFTYSFCKNEIYNKKTSPSTVGVLSEYFRSLDQVCRTNDPIFSFAVWGKDKKEYLKPTKSCFGKDSVYDILQSKNGKILLFGTSKKGYTFTHYVEELAHVSYRYFKAFSGDIIDENGVKTKTSIDYFVRDLELDLDLDFSLQAQILKNSNNFKLLKFGGADMVVINSKEYKEALLNEIKKDELCVVKKMN